MILGHHLIWTVYGWWLPNDPRCTSSHEIRVEPLASLGAMHYGRQHPGPSRQQLQEFHASAQDVLAHPVLLLSDEEIAIVGKALGEVIEERGYTCYACAILPEHVHMLVRRHRDYAEVMLEAFQEESREALLDAGRRLRVHPVWGGPGWKVFQDSPEGMVRVERYILDNLSKAGRPPQPWPFIKPLRRIQ